MTSEEDLDIPWMLTDGPFFSAKEVQKSLIRASTKANCNSSVLIAIHDNRLISSLCLWTSRKGQDWDEYNSGEFNPEEIRSMNSMLTPQRINDLDDLKLELGKFLKSNNRLEDYITGVKWHSDTIGSGLNSRFTFIVGMDPGSSEITKGVIFARLYFLLRGSVQIHLHRHRDITQMIRATLAGLEREIDTLSDLPGPHAIGVPAEVAEKFTSSIKLWVQDASDVQIISPDCKIRTSNQAWAGDAKARYLFLNAVEKLETNVTLIEDSGLWLLMVPIEELMLTRRSRCAGVLVIQKPASGANAFSMAEVTYMELASRWLSLQYMRQSYRSVAAANNELYEQLRSGPRLPVSNSLGDDHLQSAAGVSQGLFASAQHVIRRICSRLYHITWATFVHIRILDRSGSRLVNFAHEGSIPYDPSKILTLEKCRWPSVDAVVTGKWIYIPDTFSENCQDYSQLQLRLPDKSGRNKKTNTFIHTICSFPVKVYGRTVGVLTLASTEPDAFGNSGQLLDSFVELISSFSNLVALAMVSSLEEKESKLDVALGEIQVAKHELIKISRVLDEAKSKGLSAKISEHLSQRLKGVLEDGEDRTQLPGGSYSINDIINTELKSQNVFGSIEVQSKLEDNSILDAMINPESCTALNLAFHEIIVNAKYKSIGGFTYGNTTEFSRTKKKRIWNDFKARVFLNTRFAGGEKQLCIEVVNPVKNGGIPTKIEEGLFQVPVTSDDGGVHYGAFIAGQAMRHVGGDIYLKQDIHPKSGQAILHVRIELPFSAFIH